MSARNQIPKTSLGTFIFRVLVLSIIIPATQCLGQTPTRDLDVVINNPESVIHLDLSDMHLRKLPRQIENCTKLRVLNISGNKLKSIPSWLKSLRQLQELDVSGNQLKEFPGVISTLKQLKHFDASSNLIAEFTKINLPEKLEFLDVSNNYLRRFTLSGSHESLLFLDVSGNSLKSIDQTTKFKKLRYLYAGANSLEDSDLVVLNELQSLRYLSFRNSQWTAIPSDLLKLERLTLLDLSENLITTLPEGLVKLKRLRYLIVSNNKFSEVPETLAKLQRLTHLDMTGNSLSKIPGSLTRLSRLQSLGLGNNKIRRLPDGIDGLTSLSSLYLWGNPVSSHSSDFMNLPQLDTLVLDDIPYFSNKLVSLALNFPEATISYYSAINRNNFVFHPLNKDESAMMAAMNSQCSTSNDGQACIDLARFFENKGRLDLSTSYYKTLCDRGGGTEMGAESCLALGELYERMDGSINVLADDYYTLISRLKSIRAFTYYEKVCKTQGKTSKAKMIQGKGCTYCQKFLIRNADILKNRFENNQAEIKRLAASVRYQDISSAQMTSNAQNYELDKQYANSAASYLASGISKISSSITENKLSKLKSENKRLERQIKQLYKEAENYISNVKQP